jgi:hypothetical protein
LFQKGLVVLFSISFFWKLIRYMSKLIRYMSSFLKGEKEKDPVRVLVTGAAGKHNPISFWFIFLISFFFVLAGNI